MSTDSQDPWTQLDQHLRQAHQLVTRLSAGAGGAAPPSNPDSNLGKMYRAAEQRANQAEVQLERMKVEMEKLRSHTSESIRYVQRLAYEDTLTGMANSNLIRQHAESSLGALAPGNQLILLIIDLDRFHLINEVLGPKAGDTLLKRVAERLNQLVGPSDALGRRGEDEFVLIFANIPSAQVESRTSEIASRIKQLFDHPFTVDGQKFSITVTVGASYCPDVAQNAEELFQQADSALLHGKKQGRDQWHLYNPELKKRLQRNTTLEFQMRHALQSQEFFIEYLPFLWMEQKKGKIQAKVVGAEALIRWRHRIEGILSPAEFLPLADNSGFIVPLGHWVLEQVCRQIRTWHSEGMNIFTSINLSGRQLLQIDLAEEMAAACQSHQLEPHYLTFELSENFAGLDQKQIDQTIAKLAGTGFHLAIDDFDAGSSSLSRLARARYLKLAPKLVRSNTELCRQAVAVAASLGLIATGVGVEQAETARFLLESGCAMVQGYFFSQPVKAGEIRRMVQEQQVWEI